MFPFNGLRSMCNCLNLTRNFQAKIGAEFPLKVVFQSVVFILKFFLLWLGNQGRSEVPLVCFIIYLL